MLPVFEVPFDVPSVLLYLVPELFTFPGSELPLFFPSVFAYAAPVEEVVAVPVLAYVVQPSV